MASSSNEDRELEGPASAGLLTPAIIIVLLIGLAKVFGFVEKLVLGYFEGTSSSLDAYFTATKISFGLYVLGDDIIAPVLLATYVKIAVDHGNAAAYRFFWRVLRFSVVVFAAISGGILLFPHQVIAAWAPGFDATDAATAVACLQWTAPAGGLLAIGALTYVALNARRSFAWPQLGAAANKLVIVLGLVLLMPRLGLRGAAMAVCAGAVAQLIVHGAAVKRTLRPAPGEIEDAAGDGRRPGFLLPMLPLAAGALFSQLSGAIDNAWASTLADGSIAALDFARKLVDLPVLLIASVMGIVAFPELARRWSRRDAAGEVALTRMLVRTAVIVFLPLTFVFAVAAPDIVAVVFRRGEFGDEAVAVTARVMSCFSLGLVAFAVEIVVIRAFFARLDTVTPIVVGLVFACLNIGLTIVFVPVIGVIAVPLALTVQKTLKVVCLLWLLRRRTPEAAAPRRGREVRAILAGAVFGVVFSAAWLLLRRPETASNAWRAAAVAAPVLVAAIPYAILLARWELVEWGTVRAAAARLARPLRRRFTRD